MNNYIDCEMKEVIHGEWFWFDGIIQCSACGFMCDEPDYLGKANYCPECGAKMDLN